MQLIKRIIDLAIDEDIGAGDITTDNLVTPDLPGKGIIIAKEQLVIAGLGVAKEVFLRFDPDIVFEPDYKDGDIIEKGKIVINIEGKLSALLKGERTALNFLQRLSGIATNVRSFVNELGNSSVRLVDTRKTTPGLRILEKYAVMAGGARNHRTGLYDGVLIKDNHIAVCGGIKNAVERVRKKISHLVKIEVEVSNLAEVTEALDAGADVIMLDNMDIQQIKESIGLIKGKAIVEVSGMVKKSALKKLAETGVDIISVGALTHAARSVDLSMRISQ
jgi:nicotinate-nucleotide pyrophosphorylase (carboxylating)